MASERTEEQKRELYAPSLWRRRTYNGTLSMHTYMLQISAIYQCTKDWLKEVWGRRN